MHDLWPNFHFQLNGATKTTIADGLGYFLVGSCQGQVTKVKFKNSFALKWYLFDAVHHKESNGGLRLVLVGH